MEPVNLEELQKQVELGRQAEEFLKYISERPYFCTMLEALKLGHFKMLGELAPDKMEEFKNIRTRMILLDEIVEVVRSDVFIGQHAYQCIYSNKTHTEGIL